MTDLLDRYLACWNETDAQTRKALLAEHWMPDATYVDPLMDVAAVSAIDTAIAAVQAQFPGFVFTPVGAADTHHNVTRFSWGLGPVDAEPVVVGFDVVTTSEDGRIESVIGFLDRVPDLAA